MKLNIDINICSPTLGTLDWGDTAFGQSLIRRLEARGHSAQLRCLNDWYESSNSDLTITIVGKYKYKVAKNCLNFAWVISHPEVRTEEELNQYDAVFVASSQFAKIIGQDLIPPCYYLPQATDEDRFFPRENIQKTFDILFVGNNYYDNFNLRRVISDLLAINKSYDFKVVGRDWNKGLPKDKILSNFVDYNELPELYKKAKIVLNDHHELMRRYGFVNNRAFDLGRLRQCQISDYVPGIEEWGIPFYRNVSELENKLEYYLKSDSERKRQEKITFELTKNSTFDRRAEYILEVYRELEGSLAN